jgi:hypothetical protein
MAPPRSSHQNVLLGVALVAVALFLALTGCPRAVRELDSAKELQKAQKYEQLAALKIECKAKDEGCNQLHLLKGDACFRLARQATDNNTKRTRLDCATTELPEGIDMTKDWSVGQLDRAQFYGNTCEAARLRADFGDRPRFEGMLASRAKQFVGFAPDDPGAVFFDARAEFYTLSQAGYPCNGLRTLNTRVVNAAQRFGSDPRYGGAHQALKATVGVELQRRCGN